MALVRQPKTAGFRPISKYEITYPGHQGVNAIMEMPFTISPLR